MSPVADACASIRHHCRLRPQLPTPTDKNLSWYNRELCSICSVVWLHRSTHKLLPCLHSINCARRCSICKCWLHVRRESCSHVRITNHLPGVGTGAWQPSAVLIDSTAAHSTPSAFAFVSNKLKRIFIILNS